jgi:hypothetical protein
VNTSKLGALVEPRLFRALKTSSSEGIEHKKMLSSSVMIGVNKSNISASIGEFKEVSKLVKCEVKEPPIFALNDTQIPDSSLRKLMAYALLLKRIEV